MSTASVKTCQGQSQDFKVLKLTHCQERTDFIMFLKPILILIKRSATVKGLIFSLLSLSYKWNLTKMLFGALKNFSMGNINGEIFSQMTPQNLFNFWKRSN